MVIGGLSMVKSYQESILLGICQKLQLTPSLYEQATERYETIANIIQTDEVFNCVELKMYPQGSFRLKTTIKPLNEEEYDLDFVAELPVDSLMTPQELYNHIVRILKNDGIHNNMVELKKRCVRVKYANDFHIDIMPGKLINSQTHEIIVPDRELKGWNHHSNPIGFADWFEKQARTRILMEMNEIRVAQYNLEPVTDQEVVAQLEPLRRAVQLVKRYRDIYCAEHNTEPVRSIVICTLMGYITSFTGGALDIIKSFCNYVNGLIAQSGERPFEVINPVVKEKLTEKWDDENNYRDFVDMMTSLTNDINTLSSLKINNDINKITKKAFGESITNAVIKDFAISISENRENGKLSVNELGTLNTIGAGVLVKKNTFYGDD